jgi:hypothetical protein
MKAIQFNAEGGGGSVFCIRYKLYCYKRLFKSRSSACSLLKIKVCNKPVRTRIRLARFHTKFRTNLLRGLQDETFGQTTNMSSTTLFNIVH